MDRVEQMIVDIPPFARAWLASIVVLSVATSNGIVEPIKLIFIPNKIMKEPWRLVTLFCYFGPLSFALVQNLLLISRSTSSLEGAYMYDAGMIPEHLTRSLDLELSVRLKMKVEKYKMIDFAYFIFQIAASIIMAASATYTLLGFAGTSLVFPAPILERSLLYIWCKTSPEGELIILGFPVKAKYALWVTQLLYGLLSEDFIRITVAFRSGLRRGMWTLLTCDSTVELMVVFLVAHFWWYVRYFLLGDLYNENKTVARRARAQAYKKITLVEVGDSWSNSLRLMLPCTVLALVTPPWYWVICGQLRAQQVAREARANEVGNVGGEDELEGGVELEGEVEPEEGVEPQGEVESRVEIGGELEGGVDSGIELEGGVEGGVEGTTIEESTAGVLGVTASSQDDCQPSLCGTTAPEIGGHIAEATSESGH